jgi:hypothetical protein
MPEVRDPGKLSAVPEDADVAAVAAGTARPRTREWLAAAFLLYLLLSLLITWPLAVHLSDGVPHDLADPLLNTWLLWWNAHAIPFSAQWWDGPFFHPIPGVLSFSESLVGLTPLATPLQWLGAPALAAYNAAFVASFALSAFSMHLLARALGLRPGASLVAGLAFGFAPHRAADLAHLQVLSAYFIPLVFLAAHRFVQGGRRIWLGLFGGAWVLQGLSNGYFLAYTGLLFAAWLLWFARSMPDRRRAASLVFAWGLALSCLAPVLWRYSRWHAAYGFERRIEEIESFSVDVRGFLAAPPGLAHWTQGPRVAPESCLFPGITLLVLLATLLAAGWRRRPRGDGRTRLALAIVAAVTALAAAFTAVSGPWRLSLLGLTVSVKALSKPLAVALYALVLLILTSRSVRDAWRRGSVPAFYILAAAAAVVLALGPNPGAGDLKVWDKAPYYFLLELPGLSALRAPTRLATLAVFGLALVGGAALDRLVRRRGSRSSLLLVALAAGGVLWDGWLAPLPIVPAPAMTALPAEAAGASVLELPSDTERDTAAMFRATGHRRPVVNGYSGYAPPHYLALRAGLRRGEPDVLDALCEHDPVLVLLDASAQQAAALRELVLSRAGVASLGADGGREAYLLPARPPVSEPALGGRLPVRLLQGGARRAVFELERPGPVGGVLFHFGAGVSNLPAAVTIETGDNGLWKIDWRGPVAGRALRGALRDPKRVPVVIATPGAGGRLLRVRVDGDWTIEDVVPLLPRAE